MISYVVKSIVYFAGPGAKNTDKVIEVVGERVKDGDIEFVVVASITGQTALKVSEALKDTSVSVVCISGPPFWQTFRNVDQRLKKHPYIDARTRKLLEELKVKIIDNVPSPLGDNVDYGLARYGFIPASWAVYETLLAIGGYGFKTAVEAVLIATDCGAIPPFKPVISIAGTDRGADTAVVAKSTYSPCLFSKNKEQRFQVLEILAMPKNKEWYGELTAGEFNIKELG